MADATNIQVKQKVRAALGFLATEMKLKRGGRRSTPGDVIWELIKQQRPDVIALVESMELEEESDDEPDRLKQPA